MYTYSVQPMPGHKSKVEGDPSIRYQVTRHNTGVATKHKNVKDVIRTDLGYEEAVALMNGFNEAERGSQARRDEKAREGRES